MVPFFTNQWIAAVDYGWFFGMMAFFSLIAFAFAFLLAWKGQVIRKMSLQRFQQTEDGEHLF